MNDIISSYPLTNQSSHVISHQCHGGSQWRGFSPSESKVGFHMLTWAFNLDLLLSPRVTLQEGICLHNIVPRTLERMSQSSRDRDQTSMAKVTEICNAMKAAQMHGDDSDAEQEPGNDEHAWTSMLKEAFEEAEAEQSFAQIVQKRRKLTFSAFRDSLLFEKTVVVESLVQPNLHHMYLLFKRTEAIGLLDRLLPSDHDQRAKYEKECLALHGSSLWWFRRVFCIL